LPRLSPDEDQGDCSGSTPDKAEHNNTTPSNQCLIARAGEVGQRLHLRGKKGEQAEQEPIVVDSAYWSKDRQDIKDIIKKKTDKLLSEDEFTTFLDSLGAAIEAWLQEEEPNKVWKDLTEFLVDTSTPWSNDSERARRELKGDELLEHLKDTPAFPVDQIPAMPEPATEAPVTAEPKT
jgi:hypothetical protein